MKFNKVPDLTKSDRTINSSVSSLVVVFVFRPHICESPLCPLPINVAECRKRVVTCRKKVVTCRKATLFVLKSYFYFPLHPRYFSSGKGLSLEPASLHTVSNNFGSRLSQPLLDAYLHLFCPCRRPRPDMKLSIHLRCFGREEDNRPLPCTMLQSNPVHISYSFCPARSRELLILLTWITNLGTRDRIGKICYAKRNCSCKLSTTYVKTYPGGRTLEARLVRGLILHYIPWGIPSMHVRSDYGRRRAAEG